MSVNLTVPHQTAYWGSRAVRKNMVDSAYSSTAPVFGGWLIIGSIRLNSTDPQLMKENKVTYPRESRIAGQQVPCLVVYDVANDNDVHWAVSNRTLNMAEVQRDGGGRREGV